MNRATRAATRRWATNLVIMGVIVAVEMCWLALFTYAAYVFVV